MSVSESEPQETATVSSRLRLTREKARDLLWKAAAVLLVVFLVYVLLHFGSQLIELQGG